MRKLLAFLFLVPSVALAAPTISSVTGTIQNGQTVVIAGTGYGTKSPAAPLLWAPFDNNALPSGLGQLSSFGTIENMAWDSDEGYNSGGGVKGTAGNGVWTMYVPTNGNAYNLEDAQTYTFHREKQNFIVCTNNNSTCTQNYKTWRTWPPSGSVSNLYVSSTHGRIFVENIGTESGYFKNANPSTTGWFVKERFLVGSATGVKDGTFEERFNGVTKHSGTIISRSSSAPNDWTKIVPIHGVVANKNSWTPAWDNANNLWADDLYVDRTFQRVMIGDASTLANSRKLGICIPSAWSATSITCQLSIPLNDFPAGSTAYAYVVDTTNTPNTAGKQVVIGGSVVGNPAPTITAVAPSTGIYNSPTTSTMTGTGFLSGITVMVGTMSAANVTLVNSTTVRFTMPYGPFGVTGLDLRAENSDGQFAVLPATMGYTSPPVNTAPYNVSAGDDWEITLPATALFSGAADDDGLPSGTLTYLWQQKSGPGTITFGNATALQTSAVFSSSGTYTVSLTANDSALSTESSVVTVTVNPVVVTSNGRAVGFRAR